jgi:hypothetical protein
VASDDIPEEYPEYERPEFVEDEYFYREPEALPCTPREFSRLFPTSRRLVIKHDDSTLDGNMNLRVDTTVTLENEQKQDLTLYHLRMYDLKDRDFSLRRYGRDCGREVCHSSRQAAKPASMKRPPLQRSMTRALSSFSGKKQAVAIGALKRSDSGYESMDSADDDDDAKSPHSKADTKKQPPSRVTKLEFSNYAHVILKRAGNKSGKKYSFHYWGTNYAWRRTVRQEGARKEVSYHLVNADTTKVIAHIVPEPLSTKAARLEEAKGGWVPPCSMWISDESVFSCSSANDVADVIVATGLQTLVDDCIKRRFQRKRAVQLVLPIKKMGVEYVGPKRLVDELFNRRPTTPKGSSLVSSGRQPTPLRHGTPVAAAS